jgi:hypothetical protein
MPIAMFGPNPPHGRAVRTGAPRRDLPERYGVFGALPAVLQEAADAQGRPDGVLHPVDGTTVHANQHATGGKLSDNVGAESHPSVQFLNVP